MDGHDRGDGFRSDRGATLIEVLVALSILSVAAVAILAGLQLSIKTSDIHRKQSTGGAYVRSYAEAIETFLDDPDNYVRCASAADYAPDEVDFDVPDGYEASIEQALPLSGDGSVAAGACPGADTGLQRIRVIVKSDDDRAVEKLTIVVRKACGSGSSCS
ncbi:prepilin-type N-terminal cleavage/methylation domain-containing protein [Nocardioides sp. GCM10030258]|uniref:type IV pilus modification PilV family protein n=1 Tax=unclassified Nocardioides TaxID=2615069 RepID=UPI003608AEF5